jgi:hypothetical protein
VQEPVRSCQGAGGLVNGKAPRIAVLHRFDLEASCHQLLPEAGNGVPPKMSDVIIERGPDALERRHEIAIFPPATSVSRNAARVAT